MENESFFHFIYRCAFGKIDPSVAFVRKILYSMLASVAPILILSSFYRGVLVLLIPWFILFILYVIWLTQQEDAKFWSKREAS